MSLHPPPPGRPNLNLVLSVKPAQTESVEVVEHKGRGHPDTICDGLAEALSRALCRHYIAAFGEIQHHNVDKALLCGGQSLSAFGGGRVTAPIDIYLAGRAVSPGDDGAKHLHEIAVASARDWLGDHIHALDPVRHVRIHPVLRQGSSQLRSLFDHRLGGAPRANDTSFGIGYAPTSPLAPSCVRKHGLTHVRASAESQSERTDPCDCQQFHDLRPLRGHLPPPCGGDARSINLNGLRASPSAAAARWPPRSPSFLTLTAPRFRG
ncbi:MAG: hypothetical protein K2P58_09465 [Hyphomonadaceae bacterium]|nr:hypothetical protein [Hyphomonadaceae bacterium]